MHINQKSVKEEKKFTKINILQGHIDHKNSLLPISNENWREVKNNNHAYCIATER